jgi:glutathione-independent formaldehyde dehydrogenase
MKARVYNGQFWLKGQRIGTGQVNVKAYNRQLCEMIHTAEPRRRSSCRIRDAPDADQHFDARENGWTKVILKPAA